MKSSLFVCGVFLSLVVLPVVSQAGVDTADWSFSDFATFGSNIETGALNPALNDAGVYALCDLILSKVEVTINLFGAPYVTDVTSQFAASQLEKHVTDVPGPLPSGTDKLYLFQDFPLSLSSNSQQMFSLNISSYLDSAGNGYVELTDVSLGNYSTGSEEMYPVFSVSLSGTDVATVPEPISLGLMGAGVIGLVVRRRR